MPGPPSLPPETISEIALHIACKAEDLYRTKTLQACALVSQTFLAQFRPYIFESFTIFDSSFFQDHRSHLIIQNLLDVINSSGPQIATYVKHVVLLLNYSANDPLLPSVLSKLTMVSRLMISGNPEIRWNELTRGLQSSIVGLCQLETMKELSLTYLLRVPPSLFLYLPPHFVSLNLYHCRIVTDEGSLNAPDHEHQPIKCYKLAFINTPSISSLFSGPNVPFLSAVQELKCGYRAAEGHATQTTTSACQSTLEALTLSIIPSSADTTPIGQPRLGAPVDLTNAIRLRRLKIECLREGWHLIFEEFLSYIRATLLSATGAGTARLAEENQASQPSLEEIALKLVRTHANYVAGMLDPLIGWPSLDNLFQREQFSSLKMVKIIFELDCSGDDPRLEEGRSAMQNQILPSLPHPCVRITVDSRDRWNDG